MGSRVVVVDQVYRQTDSGDENSGSHRFTRFSESEEQVYGPRRVEISGDWQPLDIGWVTDASSVVIENPGPKYNRIPTDEQKALDDAKVLEVSFVDYVNAALVVRPGEHVRFEPADLHKVRIRCASEQPTKYLVTIYPK